jgi:hypothetical protein
VTRNKKTALYLTAAAAALGGVFFLTQKPSDASSPVQIARPVQKPVVKQEERIQVALLLDTSSSMDGLIDQARSEMWSLVNELAQSTRNGSLPTIEIALYEYGKSTLSEETGYIRNISPFTKSLDSVSEALFALETNGGDEYAGQVIQHAVENLQWDKNDKTLKIVFIAGNEEFTQGPVQYATAIAAAQQKGITVNTIYCGSSSDSVYAGWVDGARLARGTALHIDQNAQAVYIAAPQDAEIARLSQELNKTYVGFGPKGEASKERQAVQDKNLAAAPAAAMARAESKASKMYDNSDWDIVDAFAKKGKTALALDEAAMPEEMRGMSTAEQEKYVKDLQGKRDSLQAQIQSLTDARKKHIAKAQAEAGPSSRLDKALIETVRTQATAKGYVFKK